MDAPASMSSFEEPAPGRHHAVARAVTSRRRLIADRAARWLVTGGGLTIIASILGILLFIVVEVRPLAAGAEVIPVETGRIQTPRSGALLTDEHRTHVAGLAADGRLTVSRLADGAAVIERSVLDEGDELLAMQSVPDRQLLAGSTADGRVIATRIRWEVTFEGQERVVTPRIEDPFMMELDPDRRPLGAFAMRADEDGAVIAVGQLADTALAVARRTVEQNLFTGELSESRELQVGELAPRLTHLVTDGSQTIYGATDEGDLVWWNLQGARTGPIQVGGASTGAVTALALLLGDRSLVVGRDDGRLEIWFKVRQPDESFVLERIREFPAQPAAIRSIAHSLRGKSFLALDAGGTLGLYHSTSRRVLWTGSVPLAEATNLTLAPRADGAFVAGVGALVELEIDNPHPEISVGALFGKVWYEGYEKPGYVWQSSSGSDDFEPKLSLVPLIAGTLKGTVYSLILAVPLAVLGAMYTSQFMQSRLKSTVKPVVEIMAALPSVVLGFLAGLWLAPRVEAFFPGLLLMMVSMPLSVLGIWVLIRRLPAAHRSRLEAGGEVILYLFVLTVAGWISIELSDPVERLVFGGSFPSWLLELTGLRYDQRNAIVVGIAMGFAVIPVIFSIAEEAFSNVPRSLVSGSLALGANRWQTVTRVVLPAASPGIFSAIMIGFGRAVGETMIVLMATGNTPVLDWNPFNGFRTLSANIAVEIPEAPQGGTLYRTLFLAALILFAFTFAVNTVAELVRQRLRERYSEV